MSALTSSMARCWSGVSSKGKASSTSRCHGVSGANAWPGLASRRRYRTTSSGRDLAHRGAHARLRLLEVGTTHPVQRRRLAAGVAPDGVDLVGRDVELVAALVLEQQVVARRAADRALDHPRVARDAVDLVHDVVTGAERVVEVAPWRAPRGRRCTRRRPVRSDSATSARPTPGTIDAPVERRDDDRRRSRRRSRRAPCRCRRRRAPARGGRPSRCPRPRARRGRRAGEPPQPLRRGLSVSPTTGSKPVAAR